MFNWLKNKQKETYSTHKETYSTQAEIDHVIRELIESASGSITAKNLKEHYEHAARRRAALNMADDLKLNTHQKKRIDVAVDHSSCTQKNCKVFEEEIAIWYSYLDDDNASIYNDTWCSQSMCDKDIGEWWSTYANDNGIYSYIVNS